MSVCATLQIALAKYLSTPNIWTSEVPAPPPAPVEPEVSSVTPTYAAAAQGQQGADPGQQSGSSRQQGSGSRGLAPGAIAGIVIGSLAGEPTAAAARLHHWLGTWSGMFWPSCRGLE